MSLAVGKLSKFEYLNIFTWFKKLLNVTDLCFKFFVRFYLYSFKYICSLYFQHTASLRFFLKCIPLQGRNYFVVKLKS